MSTFAYLCSYYPQYYAKRNGVVFEILTGRFSRFSPHSGDMLDWWRWNLVCRRGTLLHANFTTICILYSTLRCYINAVLLLLLLLTVTVQDAENWNFA